ncbi:unnamed protein product [Penicillium nalgiovense]|nr:unnamed protein product [Penicillium nalgiovense]
MGSKKVPSTIETFLDLLSGFGNQCLIISTYGVVCKARELNHPCHIVALKKIRPEAEDEDVPAPPSARFRCSRKCMTPTLSNCSTSSTPMAIVSTLSWSSSISI